MTTTTNNDDEENSHTKCKQNKTKNIKTKSSEN